MVVTVSVIFSGKSKTAYTVRFFRPHCMRMMLHHACRKCGLPKRAAENIPHTWQHWLKIALKPLIHQCKIFALQTRDPRLFRSRFDASSLLGHLTFSTNSSVVFIFFFLTWPLNLFLLLSWGFLHVLWELNTDFFFFFVTTFPGLSHTTSILALHSTVGRL